MDQKIGFIGLGQMGKWMALNLLNAGFTVRAYDIDPQAVSFLENEGAKSGKTPSEIAEKATWVFMSLPNTDVVETVVFGKDGLVHGAKPGLVVVDLSTIGYLATLAIGEKLGARGIRFADAPVSGMDHRAREGTLTVMFGGDAALFDTLQPALNVIGNKIVHMGPVGSGQLTKLINQLLYNISCAGMAEVLPMAVRLGLDPEKVAQVVTTGTGRSFAAEYFVPLTLENRFDQGYPIKNAYKDLVSAAEISAHQKIPLPVVQATTATFQMALAEGFGDLSKGSLIKVFERILGVEFRKKGDAS